MDFFPSSGEPGSEHGRDQLERYFHGRPGERPFTGAYFERFAGGGDREEVADRFTADDLIAVSMLQVHVPAEAARSILETDAAELSGLLAEVPHGRDLWEARDEDTNRTSAAWQLWCRLDDYHGVGPTITSKLLARKRPRLLPVLDEVILRASDLRLSEAWDGFRTVLTPERVEALRGHRERARVGEGVSVLRVLDVLLWMTHRRRR